MAAVKAPINPIADWEQVRDEWLGRLSALVKIVERWAQEFGWSTRRIDVQMEDSQIGDYTAQALLLQEGRTRLQLEPIARFASGVEGVVHLYEMPAYDDIVALLFHDGNWHLHFLDAPKNGAVKPKLFAKKTLKHVLDGLKKNAARPA